MAVLAHPCGTKNDSTPRENDWTKPAAIFPRSPACYGFTIIAKIIPGREPVFYEYSKKLEKAVSELPDSGYSQVPLPAMGALSYQRRNYFMYQGIFDTDFDKYTEDAVNLFRTLGISTVFENLEGFPEDWKTNAPAFIKICSRSPVPRLPGIRRVSVCKRRRNQEGAQIESRILHYAGSDAVS